MKALVLMLARRRRRLTGIGITLVALLVGGGAAFATIPGGGGAISGCYQKEEGLLRVIDAMNENCRPSETALNWNVAGPQGPQGAKGDIGPTGPAGPQGLPGGLSGYEVVREDITIPAGTSNFAVAECPTGKRPLSGGFLSLLPSELELSFPAPSGTGWYVRLHNPSSSTSDVARVFAVCADVS